MATNLPLYSHPLRAKVVVAKGLKGDSPTAKITKNSAGLITITITNPNDGHPTSESATMQTPSAKVTQTSAGATITVKDDFGTTTANLANGVSITSAYISNNNHLMIVMSSGVEVDAGEIPVGALEVVDTITLDGTSKTYTMTADVPQDEVAYILINGLVNTNGYTISNTSPRTITLDLTEVPTGTLEIVQNTSGYIGERMNPITDGEINNIVQ